MTDFLTANRIAVRFCLLFPALLLLCWVALQRAEVNRLLTLPFATLIARSPRAILRLLHAGAALSGAVITGPGVSLIVVDRCSTLFEMGIFLAALIAYPARLTAKLWARCWAWAASSCWEWAAWWRSTTSAATRPASLSWRISMSDNHSSSSLSSSSGSTGSNVSPGRRSLRGLTLLRFLGKFVLCYALTLALWTLLLPVFMAALMRVSGAVWPLVSPAGVSLRLEGLEIVAETTEFSLRAGQVERTPFTAVTVRGAGVGDRRAGCGAAFAACSPSAC